ncbi:hypothetical protein C8R45DRAFT_459912 [Mycena sanguinolenta]|nr:hypothetical protein C8R45DRAFT_459912 [Mycena sanguinolenta]
MQKDPPTYLESNASGLEMSDPPAYTRVFQPPPSYHQSTWDLNSYSRFNESNRQLELQMLLSILVAEALTLILAHTLPLSGEPTSLTHTYSFLILALVISVALFCLRCKAYVNQNHTSLFRICAEHERQARTRMRLP